MGFPIAVTCGRRQLVAAVLACCFLLSSRAGAAETIRVSGTGSALGTIELIAEEFRKAKGITVIVAPSMGSGGGIKAVAEGALDVAFASRPLTEEERRRGLSVLLYATSPFVPVAHHELPVREISRADVARILEGSLTSWPNGERIRFVLRPASDMDSELLRSLSPQVAKALDAARSREGMLIGLTDQSSVDLIEATPGALGFSSLTLLKSEKRRVRILSLDGVSPEGAESLSGARGPLKSLYAVTRADAPAAARAFVQFLQSSQSRKILQRTGSTPVQQGPASR